MECVLIKDIIYLESEGAYTNIFFERDEIASRQLCRNIGVFAERLMDMGFLRCHRSYLINPYKVIHFCSKTRFIFLRYAKLRASVRHAVEIFPVLLEKGIKDISNQEHL